MMRVPLYLTTRDVLHSTALWTLDVRGLEPMWAMPARKPQA
jgi:hypothetical protein